MKRSTDRILTSHTGSLYEPPAEGADVLDGADLAHPSQAGGGAREEVRRRVEAVVRKQVDVGLDVINNGDISVGMQILDLQRVIGGTEWVPLKEDESTPVRSLPDLDMETYHEYYGEHPILGKTAPPPVKLACTGPLTTQGEENVAWDIATLKEAVADQDVEETFMDFISPGWVTRFLFNQHYATDEEFHFALAAALKPHYKAIVDAGFILQIDAPDIVDTWSWERWTDVTAYRKQAEMQIEAINSALQGLPEDRVRLHFCWGSWHGPHSVALPLEEVLDLIYRVPAQCISLEAAKPNHTHEWRAFKDHPLPDGKILMPGVIDHTTPVIEHPQVIADRLVTYANIVGRENVIAGTDCGMRIDSRVEWAKLAAMVTGAELATRELFA